MTARRLNVPRAAAGIGLLGVAAIHLLWATGSAWPAKSRAALADAVVGNPHMPGTVPTVVAGLTMGAGGCIALTPAVSGPIRTARWAMIAALMARAAIGERITDVLQLPEASPTFRRLDRRIYRPLCGVLAGLLLLGERARSSSAQTTAAHAHRG